MSKILIFGDTHGDWNALNQLTVKVSKRHEDITAIVQVGDHGQFWHTKNNGLSQLNPVRKDIPFYFIDGNHDNHPYLREYDKHPHAPNVFYQPRGSVLEIESLRLLCMGGASSIDKDYRLSLMNQGSLPIWWPEETITREEFEKTMAAQGPFDAVLTHEKAECYIYDPPSHHHDPSIAHIGKSDRIAVQSVIEHHRPRFHFFGHWHLRARGILEHSDGTVTQWHCCPEVGYGAPSQYLIWDGNEVIEYGQ